MKKQGKPKKVTQTSPLKDEVYGKEIDARDLNTTALNKSIREAAKNNKHIVVKNVQVLDSVCVGMQRGVEVLIKGDVADYCGALNDGARIVIEGSAKRFLGDCMTGGEIIVKKTTDFGAGIGMRGGNMVILGNAGDAVGQIKKGGVLLIDGNVGEATGLFMLGGDIIVTGSLGERTGEWIVNGTIYFQGEVKKLGANTKVAKLNAKDLEKLNNLFKKYGIKAKAENFKKIVPEKLRPFYG